MRSIGNYWLGVSLSVLLILTACAPPPFPLIKASDGWVQLPQPPANEKQVIATGDSDFRSMYSANGYLVTWFQRSDDEYLVYIRNEKTYEYFAQDGLYYCGDTTFNFKKINDEWIEQHPRAGIGHICVD